MKTSLAAALVTGFVAVGAASAQDVVIVSEQETVIRRYVQERPVASVVVPGFSVSVGSAVPDEVELYAVEEGDIDYRYTVIDGRTVIVDPGTRNVVRVLD